MKPIFFLLLLTCILVRPSNSFSLGGLTHSISGWISGGCNTIGGWLGSFMGGMAQPSIDAIVKAFKDGMDYVFDKKIQPMLDQVEAAIVRNMGIINDDIQNTINHINQTAFDVIQDAVKQAENLVNFTVEKIKQDIIDEAFSKLDAFETKFVKDINDILNKIDEEQFKLVCMVTGVETKIREDLTRTLSIIPNPFDSCRKQMNTDYPGHSFLWKPFSEFEYNDLYEFRKCKELIDLNENTPIPSILLAYRNIAGLSAEMRCLFMSFGDAINIKYYIQEMGKVNKVIELYESFNNNRIA